MKRFGCLGLVLSSLWLSCQTSITANKCLDELESLQSKGDEFYPKGIYPSQRYWLGTTGEEDNSGFYSACITYILRSTQKRKPDSRVEVLVKNSLGSFENYRSRREEPTYNFWQSVGGDMPFPNSVLMSYERMRLADDYDDTALIQLARGKHALDDRVRSKMVDYALRKTRKPVKDFPTEYQQKPVYEVWYAHKMEQQIDVVVMANVLLFTFDRNYAWEQPDSASAEVIKRIIENGHYFKDPEALSGYYHRSAVILYHLTRTVLEDRSDFFLPVKEKLIGDLKKALKESTNEMEKVMLAISLRRLNEPVQVKLSLSKLREAMKEYSYFYFTPETYLGHMPTMSWRCEAMSWALVYELLIFDPTITWTE